MPLYSAAGTRLVTCRERRGEEGGGEGVGLMFSRSWRAEKRRGDICGPKRDPEA